MARVIVVGGIAESLWRFRGPLIQELVSRGHQVIACAPAIDESTRDRLRDFGATPLTVDLDRHSRNPFLEMRRLIRLRRVFTEVKPDVVFGYTVKPVIIGSIAASLARIPRIFSMVTGLGFSFLRQTARQRFFSTVATNMYRLALRSNERVFFQNKHDAQVFLRSRIIKEASKVVVVDGSGVDLDYFEERLPPEEMSFLLMARLIREKGIYEFVDAATSIRAKYPKVRFKLAGWFEKGPTALTLDEIEHWASSGQVEYLGVLNDVRNVVAQSSVVVLPSFYPEGVPRSILEGMATGRPIITSDTPGCRETVTHGLNGFLVPPKDAVSLANVMEQFVLEPGLVEKMGRESRKIAEQRFDVKIVNKQIIGALFP